MGYETVLLIKMENYMEAKKHIELFSDIKNYINYLHETYGGKDERPMEENVAYVAMFNMMKLGASDKQIQGYVDFVIKHARENQIGEVKH